MHRDFSKWVSNGKTLAALCNEMTGSIISAVVAP